MKHNVLVILIFLNVLYVSIEAKAPGLLSQTATSKQEKKYIAFTSDTEAYFCPPEFTGWQGIFTMDIVRICEKENIPFTWLVICDRERSPREFREIDAMMKTVWPVRKDIDEFGIHIHFKYFINDTPDDESWCLPERRLAFMKAALARRNMLGMPSPASFKFGAGDSRSRFYLDDDLEYLYSVGVRNYIFRHDLIDFQGLNENEIEHKGNNVWRVRDMEDITLLRGAAASMEASTEDMIKGIDQGLIESDYILIGCHDYTAIVPGNLQAAIDHLKSSYQCEFVTVSDIGERIRSGLLKNEFALRSSKENRR